ncbi:MAG TPA: hypothetical protein DCG39_02360 [Opitutae bacterium]|nr:hypothetical protein [Opitutae bacterium]
MKNGSNTLFATFLVGLLALSALDAPAAVAPLPPEAMMEEATHVVEGKVIALSSKTQKSRVERDLLIARDRIFKITVKVTDLEKGKGLEQGNELTFEAWQPSIRFPAMPGPQGHQPVPAKGDLVKVYLLYNEKSKTYHPFMPNGISIIGPPRKTK